MKVGILGSGDVAKSLARGFLKEGHQVMLGSREPAKLAAWVNENGKNASSGTLIETARFGELAVLAVLGTKSVEAIQTAEVDNFKGKVVIDTTYPLDMSGGLPKLVGGLGTSSGELNQKALPGAFVAKERHRQLHRIPSAWGWSLQTELRPSTTEPAMPRPSSASRYSVWRWIYSPECSTSLPKPWAVFRQPAPARTTNVASNRA